MGSGRLVNWPLVDTTQSSCGSSWIDDNNNYYVVQWSANPGLWPAWPCRQQKIVLTNFLDYQLRDAGEFRLCFNRNFCDLNVLICIFCTICHYLLF